MRYQETGGLHKDFHGATLMSDNYIVKKYCAHCAGWIGPVLRKAGYYYVTVTGELDIPSCDWWIYADKAKAQIKMQELRDKTIDFKSYID